MNPIQELIRAAIINSALNDVQYLAGIFKQRNPGPDAAGSFWAHEQTPNDIINYAARAEEVDVGNLKFGDCRYFRLPCPGTVGVVGLDTLSDGTMLELLDPKGTVGTAGGGVEACFKVDQSELDKLAKVTFTMLIVGFELDKPVVFTMHPGPVFGRSASQNDPALVGQKVTVLEAKKLGLTIAKLQAK